MRESVESGKIWRAQKMEMELLKEKEGGGVRRTWRICSVRERDKHGEKVKQKEKNGGADLKKDFEQLYHRKYYQCVF